MKIPLVHGAIAGWYGQVVTIMPGERTMEKIYSKDRQRGIETRLGNPSFTPALIASIQVAEVIKLLIGRGELLSGGEILFIDTLHQEYVKATI
jgi:molybdopterin/thiamine biosynthesis adenylyltransferase